MCETPACECGKPQECTSHYILECIKYETQRRDMLEKLCAILTPNVNYKLIMQQAKDRLLHIMLHGSDELTEEMNTEICDIVQCFI